MRVYVSNADYQKAKASLKANPSGDVSETCPLARALKRRTKNKCAVEADRARVYKQRNGHTVPKTYMLSSKAEKAVTKFDCGKKFPAGHYYLTEV